jgi:hypothetical protein
MRRILLHNWKEKLVCLLVGAALWYLISQNLGPHPEIRSLRGKNPESAGKSLSSKPTKVLPKNSE